LTRSRADCKI